jgi:hypothetical protein
MTDSRYEINHHRCHEQEARNDRFEGLASRLRRVFRGNSVRFRPARPRRDRQARQAEERPPGPGAKKAAIVAMMSFRMVLGASLATLVVAGAGCGGGPLLTGMNRADAGNGADADGRADAKPVVLTIADLVGPVVACGGGRAHPNVCCRGGACRAQPDAPFAACAAGTLTFPDRRRCCALGTPADCVDQAPSDAGSAGPAFGACSLPCGPEGRPADGDTFPACFNEPTTVACEYCCAGLGCTANICHCPASPTPCACDTPACAACPDGWSAVVPQVDLCCREGAHECFSQSTFVRAPAEGGGTFSGPDRCEKYESSNGHVYDAQCDKKVTPACTCSLDGTTTMTFDFGDGACEFATCGFSP